MLEISVDWLQFTSKNPNPIDVIIHNLHLDVKLFQELPSGKLGYKKQLFYENIFILFDGNEDMGTHVIMSGKGCRTYESHYPIIKLIESFEIAELKATRIDLAIDDKEGKIIKLDNIVEDTIKGNVVSKWKTSTEIIKRNLSDGEKIGQTIYLGSRKSEVFMRIYDKSMQQNEEGNWVRIELEIKGKKAVELQKILQIENAGSLTKGIINNYFRIVEPGKDKNKSRWKTKKYWTKIIDSTEKIKLSRIKEEKTIDETKEWLMKQLAPTIASTVIADEGDLDFIVELIKDGQKRMKPKHYKMIEKEHDKDAE